jgi:peroxiredoxin
MHALRAVVGFCLIATLIAGCSRRGGETQLNSTRKMAPDFTLKDSDSRRVSLSDYKGKVVLINFWETWCAPCRIEIPWFIEFEQQYKDRGFAILGVALDGDGWKVVRPYMQEKRINYRILLGNSEITQLYGGVDALPTTFVVDREGRIASTHVGLISKDEYKKEIEQLLQPVQRSGTAAWRALDCNC